MLINVKIKKKMFFIGRTDTRTTQNYSSEPHNTYVSKTNKQMQIICVNIGKHAYSHHTQMGLTFLSN